MAAAMDIAPHDVGFGRFGHGIGLHVPEPPSLHADDPTPLEAGFTVCIEPTVVHAGVNYVVEEEYILTAAGLERLSPAAPEEILVL
jgi:Xaa-Pro aminopeptidase